MRVFELMCQFKVASAGQLLLMRFGGFVYRIEIGLVMLMISLFFFLVIENVTIGNELGWGLRT